MLRNAKSSAACRSRYCCHTGSWSRHLHQLAHMNASSRWPRKSERRIICPSSVGSAKSGAMLPTVTPLIVVDFLSVRDLSLVFCVHVGLIGEGKLDLEWGGNQAVRLAARLVAYADIQHEVDDFLGE